MVINDIFNNRLILFLSLSLLVTNCDRKADTKPVENPPVQNDSFTSVDATSAFESFNHHFYNSKAKLYYSTTERSDLGSIWTQAIFWDIVMDAYQRTDDSKYLQMIRDSIYTREDIMNMMNTTGRIRKSGSSMMISCGG